MLSELPKIEIPGPEGWDIKQDGDLARADVRHFIASPKERLVVDYVTVERYRRRLIEAVYPCEISMVRATYFWNQEKEEWKPSIGIHLFILNPRTMERYSLRNPMSGGIHVREPDFRGEDEVLPSRLDIERVIVEATQPKTRIIVTITEEPLNA